MPSLSSFSASSISGDSVELSRYQGQVALIVNVASQCGFTPQYRGLEALYLEYRDQGFTVLGFPCDQFGHQEPGTEAEILDFCTTKYAVSFPLFAKIDVNGAGAHPLYQWLKEEKSGVLGTQAIKWNFTKFLVGRDGQVLKRYGSSTAPDELRSDIQQALAAPSA
ncbi:MAG TPA: glutathione peroxidase [Eoetvoesiella sp.]|uniref:glutathione peroxidase n=1 Tax=Eoetvoesiella sp. TaxID=1966355 RepID=UPI002D0D5AEB|nr:glutathione peroxidase [Eoetvoesiella sp.]HWK62963.1 glutathione peroxidase [Eoetvoesiella sp.]